MSRTTLQAVPEVAIPAARCEFTEDFYELCDEDGYFRGLPKTPKAINAILRIPTTLADAHHIVAIYQEVYQGTYPYPEMLRADWIYDHFADPTYLWGIFETDDYAPTPHDIVGCFTMVLDFARKTCYFRGMMIRPGYQKAVALRELSFAMFYRVLDQHLGPINKFYCEARTAHNITQYLASVAGCNLHAIFPQKDCFYRKRETDAFMVGFTRDAIDQDRCRPAKLHPKVLPLLDYVAELYRLRENPHIESPCVLLKKELLSAKIAQGETETTIDPMGYVYLTIRSGSACLTALHTPSIGIIEKVATDYSSPDEFYALAVLLRRYMQKTDTFYVEWFLPADRVIEQELLFQLKFALFGYLPAWLPASDGSGFDDAVVMGHSREVIATCDHVKLLPEGILLRDLIYAQLGGELCENADGLN
jgi:hypothetical protein